MTDSFIPGRTHPVDHPNAQQPEPTARSRSRGRTAKRIAGLTVALAVGFFGQIVIAPTAQAGTLALTAEIQGAGSVYSVEAFGATPRYSCTSPTGQNDDRVVTRCQRQTFEKAFQSGMWLEAAPASGPVAGNWRFVGWVGCDQTRVAADGEVQCFVTSGAFSLDEKHPRAIFDDAQAPSLSGPNPRQSLTSERTFTFDFSSNDNTARFWCRLDAEPYTTCSSGISKTMTEGSHSFQVYAADPSGNQSPVSNIAVTAVDTAITGGPAGLVNDRTAIFNYATIAGNSFECSLDFGAWGACGTGNDNSRTYTGLADGAHHFQVRASNGGWTDRLPATRSWTIDATPPTTSLDATSINGRDASFGFSAAAASGFQCRLTGPTSAHDWQPCSTPTSYADLSDGDYRFEVRASDAAGNVDPSPPSHSWTIDLTAPETTIGSAPAEGSWVLSRAATLALTSTETGSAFTCTLDGVGRTCGPASLQLTNLASGTHSVTATATDAAGNTDSTPARRTWTVPFDDTQLDRTNAWAQKSAPSAYLGTYSAATLKGASLKKQVADATKIALVAKRAPGHGTVKVFLGTTLLKQVNLTSATVQNKRVIPVVTFPAPTTGTVKVVVATAGKQVHVDGLGIATS